MNNIFVYYDETNTHLVSSNGVVQNTFGDIIEPYKSSSNILYSPYTFDGGITRLKRLDIIVALTFNPIPDELIGLPLTVKHIDENPINVCSENLEWIEDIEEWRTSHILKGYKISSWGRIMSPYNEIIKGTNKDGYIALTINERPGSGDKRVTYLLHRLVASLFIGDITGKDVNHIDGIRNNPRLDNLEIISRCENNIHAINMGMHSNKIDAETGLLIDKLLFKYDGSPIKVVNHMKSIGFDNITETIVALRKKKLIKNGHDFRIKYRLKLNDPILMKLIIDLLIKYDGNVQTVYSIINEKYPDITDKNIKTVKSNLSHNGIHFKNGIHNRKISEEVRNQLLHLLEINDWSVSATYKYISNLKEFDLVSVYDLKYLKRKYGV